MLCYVMLFCAVMFVVDGSDDQNLVIACSSDIPGCSWIRTPEPLFL